jgi:hypothetical protein
LLVILAVGILTHGKAAVAFMANRGRTG